MGRPTLVIVSGGPGTGKTTLARLIAASIPCGVVSRDALKQGLVHAAGGGTPSWGGPVSQRTHELFFSVLRTIIGAGATVVAEAALQNDYWRPDLEPLLDVAKTRIVHCTVDPLIARERITSRESQIGFSRSGLVPIEELLDALDSGAMTFEQFEPITTVAPVFRVDTTDGYQPSVDRILSFLNAASPG
jgi:predicted kinase